ncbi:heme ABC exporter ATP-binding protein CcmA [Pontixanthobacter gangjinensis]
MDLEAGTALHITGSNGIGKTSLMRILAGLLTPYEGHVKREGAIGLMDEHPALDPQVQLSDGLAFWSAIDGSKDCEETVHILGLDELMDVPFRFLSTGQRKRAALARLVNQDAPIWLLDEPLNGLDVDAKEQTESLIALHCDEGGICVIASHQTVRLPRAQSISLEEYAL